MPHMPRIIAAKKPMIAAITPPPIPGPIYVNASKLRNSIDRDIIFLFITKYNIDFIARKYFYKPFIYFNLEIGLI